MCKDHVAGHDAVYWLLRPSAVRSAMPDEPPENLGTIAALVFAGVVVVLVIIGAVPLITF
jgi:hypothetical protein